MIVVVRDTEYYITSVRYSRKDNEWYVYLMEVVE